MHRTPEGIDSTFRYILLAAKRAEQLVSGARPRVESRPAKSTLIALEEVRSGLVPWQPLSAEEFELLRQQELTVQEHEEQPVTLIPAPQELLPDVVEDLDVEDEDDFDGDLEEPDFSGDDLGDLDEAAEELLGGEEPKE
jgi:DNA-directed RNA polymerase subunit omega